MRTNIVIDDELMAQDLKASVLETKKDVVEQGLKLLVQRKRQQSIRALFCYILFMPKALIKSSLSFGETSTTLPTPYTISSLSRERAGLEIISDEGSTDIIEDNSIHQLNGPLEIFNILSSTVYLRETISQIGKMPPIRDVKVAMIIFTAETLSNKTYALEKKQMKLLR